MLKQLIISWTLLSHRCSQTLTSVLFSALYSSYFHTVAHLEGYSRHHNIRICSVAENTEGSSAEAFVDFLIKSELGYKFDCDLLVVRSCYALAPKPLVIVINVLGSPDLRPVEKGTHFIILYYSFISVFVPLDFITYYDILKLQCFELK